MVQEVYYPPSIVQNEAKRKIAPVRFSQSQNSIGIHVPDNRSNCSISPHYAVGFESQYHSLVFGVLDYCDDQQGCDGAAYGDIVAPYQVGTTSDNQPITVDWILAVVEVNCGKGWVREVWELSGSNVVKIHKSPVILELKDVANNVGYIPIGNPIAAIGIKEILMVLGIVGGTIVSSKLFDWLSTSEKRKMVEDITRVAENNPEVARLVLHPVGGEVIDFQNGGLLDGLKNFIVGGIGAVMGTIILIFKWRLIFDMLRDMFRRR